MKNIAITENHLYQKTYKKGKRFSGRYVSVFILKDLAARRLKKENPEKEFVNRLGISVSKKVGGAVQRNRVKRIIRAAYAEVSPYLKKGFLIVITPRINDTGAARSCDIAKELKYAFAKLEMIMGDPAGLEK